MCQRTVMAHQTPDNEPNLPATTGSARAVREDGWTPRRQAEFLRMLATTQCVSSAARSVGMGRQSAYKLRARLDDKPFGAAWRMITTGGAHEALLEAALSRAIHGVEVSHYWQGELVGTTRRYDERLTASLLKSGMLERASRQRAAAEEEYAQFDLARLLDRIEYGPEGWNSPIDERAFASGDDMSDLLDEDDNEEEFDDE